MFAVGRKEEAQKWLDVLIECSKASEGMEGSEKVPGSPLSRTDSTSSDVTDRKLVIGKTADGLEDSTGSKKDEMFDNIPSPTRGDMSPRIAKKHLGTNLADSLAQTASSLLAFARNKKGKKKSPTSPGASDIPRVVDTNTAISGYLNVCSGKLSDGKWNKSWCLIKDGMFKCYRVNSEKFEFQLHLQGCDLQPVPDGKKKAKCYLFQLVQAKESVLVAEAYDLDEMARWIRTLIKEIDSIDENLMGDYVEPEETMEFFKKIVRGQDGEVLTQKDIVAKNMKIFEKMIPPDDAYMDLIMDSGDEKGKSTAGKHGENKPAGGAKMQDQNKKGGVIRRLQEQLIESSKTGNNTAQQSRDRNVTERQNSTDNSFLDKVRIQRRLSQVHKLKSQFERLQVEKAHLNRMLSDLRSHKLELKDKKLQCREQSERKKIDNIMKDTDLEISQTEDELQQVNLQLDKISNQIDDAEDEVAVCMETVHGEDEEDDEFYDCHVFEKDINNSQSKEQNNQQTSKQAVLQRAKMWESMAKQ
ncbi:actin filament-associated protein 1-like isoform X2 [Ptychodera flava]|uniref:actin filament-associated protein 1-like isoform X2 n=1 Tax=Ptychodera flava TaxID=63121 RepID=UPI00396A034E